MKEDDRDRRDQDRRGDPRVGVLGLWHLGCVTAACLAESGLAVVGLDPDPEVVAELRAGRPPVAEPGLAELIADGQRSGRLDFECLDGHGLADIDVVWIAFDTPVDDDDRADSNWVIEQTRSALGGARLGALIIVSSQLPVGSIAQLAAGLASDGRDDLRFACVPENLRLGQALATFRSPERFVAGVQSTTDREQLAKLLTRFTAHIEWMGIESAEMTKHALNAFLATSVAFINEVASLCESAGADASEVSRGLKSDQRIGPRSYLSPGDAFAGGTLARDVSALNRLAEVHQLPAPLIAGVAASNTSHRDWARRALVALLDAEGGSDGSVKDAAQGGNRGLLEGRQVAIWGLTYKPGTNTLRRSSALDLCRWLRDQDAVVHAHDPAIDVLPDEENSGIELCGTPLAAAQGADALVICTPWPEFQEVDPEELIAAMRGVIVLDAGGHFKDRLASLPSISYAQVGTRP
jgi:UDPglucose 6-dehydrogenase